MHKNLSILLKFLTLRAPGTVPFRIAPWISEPEKLDDLALLLGKGIGQLKDVVDTVGMVENEAGGLAIDHLGALFAVTLDTAAHQAVILLALQ